jgi:ketosteroid isomerase-like protein
MESKLVQDDREARFLVSMRAFVRHDLAVIEANMRPDVVLDLPGASWLAGSYEGLEDVSRCILALRQVLESQESHLSFLHEGDQMVVRHDVQVLGPEHEAAMTLRVRIRFDDEVKMTAILVEPEDLGLFDHVVNTKLGDAATA